MYAYTKDSTDMQKFSKKLMDLVENTRAVPSKLWMIQV